MLTATKKKQADAKGAKESACQGSEEMRDWYVQPIAALLSSRDAKSSTLCAGARLR
jgi:hypothetical protein